MHKYQMIFKRKSFHLFRDNKTRIYFSEANKITFDEITDIYDTFKTFKPLIPNIKTDIKIVDSNMTTAKRGQEYCILLYSEKKQNYLQNIGYIGEQLDLYLASKNIGALWFGVGKTSLTKYNDLEFVTMILIAKVPEDNFRKDMFKSKRKPLDEIWYGEQYKHIGDIVRFAPSSCNTQPWIVKEENSNLCVYRYKKPGKRGIMPNHKIVYQNLIDIGIFLLFLETCFEKNNIKYLIDIKNDDENNNQEITLIAVFNII